MWWRTGCAAMLLGAAAAQAASVLVLPLNPINDPSMAWVGIAVQQNIVTDLGKGGRAAGMEAAGYNGKFVALDVAEAVLLGRRARATHVVFGSYQVIDGEVRVTAQVQEVGSGATAGTIKATGAFRDMLKVEDDVSAQVLQVMAQAATYAEPVRPTGEALPRRLPAADREVVGYQTTMYPDATYTPVTPVQYADLGVPDLSLPGSYYGAGYYGGGLGYYGSGLYYGGSPWAFTSWAGPPGPRHHGGGGHFGPGGHGLGWTISFTGSNGNVTISGGGGAGRGGVAGGGVAIGGGGARGGGMAGGRR